MNHITNFWKEGNIVKNYRELCCGCTACESVCGKDAITMQPDKEGFLYPIVNEERCVNCGMCQKVCPVSNDCNNSTPYIKSFAGFSTNDDIIKTCATGGIATALSFDTVKKGGVVFGVKSTDDCRSAEFTIARTEEELLKFSGSKYVQPKKQGILKLVKEELLNDKPVLFIGCPCDVAALKRYLRKDYSNLLTCELFCAGITSDKVLNDYIDYREHQMRSKLVSMNFRSKDKGWFVGNIKEVYENGKIYYKNYYGTYLGYSFLTFKRPSCFCCQYKKTTTYSDIKCGDFWGIKDSDTFWNSDGVSVILAKTQKGIDALEKLNDFKLFPVDYNRATANNGGYNSTSSFLKNSREQFERLYIDQDKGLVAACKSTAPKSFWIKYYVPTQFHVFMKKIFHMIVDRK